MHEHEHEMMQDEQAREFEREAGRPQQSILFELIDFLMHNKKWWLAPILLVLLLASILVVLGGSGAAPFVYTFF